MIKLYCRAVLSTEASPWTLDPKCYPVPWRGDVIELKGRKLRFGMVFDNDGDISVHPPILRGLEMTKRALEAAGHEIFEWEPLHHQEMANDMNSSFYTLGGAAILELTLKHDEPVFGSMKEYEATYRKGEHGTLGPTATAKNGKGPMDGIITPASPWTAPRLGITQKLFSVNYTGVWNLLGRSKLLNQMRTFG